MSSRPGRETSNPCNKWHYHYYSKMASTRHKFRAFKLSLSKISPKGLFARSLLIIVLPIALMQIMVTYVFFDLHWGQVSKFLSESAAGDVAYITQNYLKNPTPSNLATLQQEAQSNLRLSVALQENAELPKFQRKAKILALDRTINAALRSTLKNEYWYDTVRYPDYVDIRVKIPNGVLRFLAYRDRVFASTGGIFFLWVVGASVLLATVSVLFIRNQVRPIERLANAAESFGRGESVELRLAGSREIRRASQAFLEMRARIARHIEQRTNILAGVSHDLRTPLTRLKLELAMMADSEELRAAKSDLKLMEEMLDEYLAFARGQWAEGTEEIDLAQIAKAVFEKVARNHSNITSSEIENPMIISGRAVSLERLITNLVDNALSYGNNAQISCNQDERFAYVVIDDDGPGLAKSDRERAMNPFTRLDSSRNQNKKGVGLGLSIARDIAHSHGGEIILENSPMGGLRAILRLPNAEKAIG